MKNLDYWYFQHQHFFTLKFIKIQENMFQESNILVSHEKQRFYLFCQSFMSDEVHNANADIHSRSRPQQPPGPWLNYSRALQIIWALFCLQTVYSAMRLNGFKVSARLNSLLSRTYKTLRSLPTGTSQKMTSTCKDDNLRKKKGKKNHRRPLKTVISCSEIALLWQTIIHWWIQCSWSFGMVTRGSR